MSALHDLVFALPEGHRLEIIRIAPSRWDVSIRSAQGVLGGALAIDRALAADDRYREMVDHEIDRKAAALLAHPPR